jgi:hypothetical protein
LSDSRQRRRHGRRLLLPRRRLQQSCGRWFPWQDRCHTSSDTNTSTTNTSTTTTPGPWPWGGHLLLRLLSQCRFNIARTSWPRRHPPDRTTSKQEGLSHRLLPLTTTSMATVTVTVLLLLLVLLTAVAVAAAMVVVVVASAHRRRHHHHQCRRLR